MAGGAERKPETNPYKENRLILWAYWRGGRDAIASIRPDCGAAKFIEYFEKREPNAIREMARQCCGNPPQDIALDLPSLRPGLNFTCSIGLGGPALSAGRPVPIPETPRPGPKEARRRAQRPTAG